ncbi:glutaryl-CoA dehydrogenase [Thermosporothrix hazakensis]|jgi:glutaryl-CoA dehydrogenase|uniref:Glutaryl-CoA dehydrogenase n=2 Tax=Thermosporothrix TaxID=768650 RepID=A0A326UKX6_THEHA|nr:acyl-CoA dehydrogenase family protein [Thermosporothrix hazakensis]PZW33023.1 glutaryl-CoA dehydrogenase [Thermosporothrix hazakensis]BBH91004.1 glutaryl-CoA dehydrogenase [Thermosporothrix sp. COM3]GCE49054.1 glutaryl-CoA dehydrogenase [Thermosporothrix hazakensis]
MTLITSERLAQVPSATDLYNIDHMLSDEERMVRDTVRKFVRERVLPGIDQHFEAGTFPRELIPEVAEMGLLGMHLDGYDCAGLNAVCYGLACQELEAGDSGLRSFVSVQGSLAMFPIYAFGSEEQKQRWLPRMARGEVIGCFGLTEPDFGSEAAGMRTTARRDGNHYILNGTKMWITNGGIADLAVVWARTDDGIRGFLVERGTPGFTTSDIHQKLSLRASVTSELHFEDCRIPVENMLPNVKGMRGPLSCLNEARYGIAWGVLGAARTCFETALDYAKTRIQFKKPIASFQLVQRKLALIATELVKAQLLALQLGRLKDEDLLHPVQISVAKSNNCREALNIAREARTILGANGITLEYPIIRHMNNLESVFTYEGTDDIHTLIIGQAITGLDAFA